MAPVVGHDMKAYRNTGTVATPVWSEVDEIEDLNIPDLSMGLAELKRRANGFTKNLATLIQAIAVEFNMKHGMDSTNEAALRTAFLAGTVEQWAIMNGDITTTDNEGWKIPCLVEQFPWGQALEEVSAHDLRLAIAYMEEGGSEVDPSWYTVP